jgi:ribosome biogenesis GTPase
VSEREFDSPDVQRVLKGMQRDKEKRLRRLAKKASLQAPAPRPGNSDLPLGTVLTRARTGLLVQSLKGEETHWCRPQKKGLVGMPVPGDLVRFRPGSETADGWIESIEPRESLIQRWVFGRIKEVAANMEKVFILATPYEPKVSPRLVDRMLVGASVGGVEPVIVINKLDLLEQDQALEWSQPWRDAGYDILLLSAESGEGLGELHGRLRQFTSLLMGASGVGKSTVLNRLIVDLDLDTSTISEATGRGVHTTTFTRLFPVPGGGVVADSPGMREFYPVLDDPDELLLHFPEMASFVGECEFADCRHNENSRGCAVMEAVQQGDVHPQRYESFLVMLQSLREGPQRGRGRQFA